jgi:serine protease AprX
MNRKTLRTSIACALAAATALGSFAVGSASAGTTLSPKFDLELLDAASNGRAIIGFDHDVTAQTLRRLANAGITQAVRVDTIDAVGVVGSTEAYEAIARWNDVRFVDADSPVRFENHVAKKDTGVDKVRKGAGKVGKYNGKGITVAIIDTGIESTHQDLDDRVVKHVNFEPAWFFDMINDGDQDMSGVAPGATLANFKIADVQQGVDCTLPCDIGWEMNALVAYEYAIEHRNDKIYPGGIRVINNSWSTYEVDSEVEPISLIVQAAAKKGIISVFAAGNDGPGKNTVAKGPNSLESVITVAAACKSEDSCGKGKIADFSSRGPQVDIAAPGDNIYSALARASAFGPIGSHSPPGGPADAVDYVGLSGTSMAAPHVAGIVALMLDANPKLTRAQVEKILIKTAVDRGDKGFDTSWGFGMVDAYAAVNKAEALR